MSAKIHQLFKGQEEADEKKVFVRVDGALYLNTETGVYFGRKTFRHLRIPDFFQSLRETKITAARRVLEKKLEEHKAKYLGKTETVRDQRLGMTIGAIIDEMLLVVTPKKRKRTQENHRFFFKELKEEWGYLDVNRLTTVMWERWLIEFKAKKMKPDPKTGRARHTFDDYVKWMKVILNYARKHRYLNHYVSIDPTDPKKKAGRVYTNDEIKAIRDAMNEDLLDQFVLAFECFMRLREALWLTWDRIDLVTGKLVLRAEDVKTGSKTGKGRTFFVSPNALARLRARRARFDKKGWDTPYVFPSRSDRSKPRLQNKGAWDRAKKNAKIKGRARWHDIRHTSLTKALLEQKLNPVEVSEYAGVSMRTIQRVYLHSNEELTRGVSGALSLEKL